FAAKPELRPPGAEEALKDITRDTRNFAALIRNRIFNFLRGLAMGDLESALAALDSADQPEGEPWTAERLREVIDSYHAEHESICLNPEARNVRHTYVKPSDDKRTWRIQQMLVDPEQQNDWVAEFEVDLAQSRLLE